MTKDHEIALRVERFRSHIEKNFDAFTLHDQNLQVISGSPPVQQLLGCELNALVQTGIFPLIHTVDKRIAEQAFGYAAEKPGESVALTIRVLQGDKTYRLLCGYVTSHLHEPDINAFIFCFKDASEKMQIERIIEEEKLHFQALIENISDAIILVDRSGRIIYNSPSVSRITGRNSKDLRGSLMFDYFHPDDEAKAKKYFKLSSDQPGMALQHEFRVRHISGHYIWLEGTIKNLLEDPAVEAFIINYRNITDRKNTEDLLRRSQATILSIVSYADRGYMLLNKNLEVISFNKMASESFMQESGQILTEGLLPFAFLSLWQQQQVKYHLELALKGEKTSFELQFANNDRTNSWYQVKAFPVSQDNGEIIGVILDSENITDRKNSEIEKEKMTADIAQRYKELEQFAYIVSHNLRSPVANIMGISYLLKDDSNLSHDELQKCMNGILTSVKKIDEVIIDLNSIVQKRMEVRENMEQVNLNLLFSNVKDLIGLQDNDDRIRVMTDFSELSDFFTIKSYLHSIFYNLISNSIKYRDPHKSSFLKIRSYISNKKACFDFEDNGLGFNLNAYGDKVFGLYKKFHQNVNADGKGMGLFMVKTQAELLGGKINIESQENSGSRFTLVLPVISQVQA